MPEIWEENVLIYRAFWDLTPERTKGFGEGYIPFSELRAYAEPMGLDVFEILPQIRAMDSAYLEFRKKEEDDKRARDERNAKRPGVHRQHR